jgi:hypothetical protein
MYKKKLQENQGNKQKCSNKGLKQHSCCKTSQVDKVYDTDGINNMVNQVHVLGS